MVVRNHSCRADSEQAETARCLLPRTPSLRTPVRMCLLSLSLVVHASYKAAKPTQQQSTNFNCCTSPPAEAPALLLPCILPSLRSFAEPCPLLSPPGQPGGRCFLQPSAPHAAACCDSSSSSSGKSRGSSNSGDTIEAVTAVGLSQQQQQPATHHNVSV
jgi:hypothetical protein